MYQQYVTECQSQVLGILVIFPFLIQSLTTQSENRDIHSIL